MASSAEHVVLVAVKFVCSEYLAHFDVAALNDLATSLVGGDCVEWIQWAWIPVACLAESNSQSHLHSQLLLRLQPLPRML